MQFVVPKFIEREAKIVGPLTFKQFAYIAIAGGISFVLYFIFPKISYTIITAVILIGGAAVLAFVNIEGRSLPVLIKDFFVFTLSPRLFIWKKKGLPPKLYGEKAEPVKTAKTKKPEEVLTIDGSKLRQLSTQLETKTK